MKLRCFCIKKKYEIDAGNYSYGNLCQKVAHLIMDKDNVNRVHNNPNSYITVKNLYLVRFSGKNKLDNLKFYHHSGYPGGLKIKSIKKYIEEKKLERCLRESVLGMLSKTIYYQKAVAKKIIFK